MAELRQHSKPDSIWLFDYTSLAAMDDCADKMVWLSERDINLIWQATLNVGRFRSRVFTAKNGEYYTIATLDQFGEYQSWLSDMNVHLGEFEVCNELMATQNELLAGILTALQRLADCTCTQSPTVGGTGGSRGSGTTGQSPVVYSQSETPDVPPSGFGSMAEFTEHKCNAAALVVQDIRDDLQSMSILELVGVGATILATTLAVTLLTPVPFDDLLVISTSVIVGAVSASYLSTLAGLINDNIDDLICSVYNSASAEEAQAALVTGIDALIDGEASIPAIVKPWMKQISDALVSTDALNRVFSNVPVDVSYDCSACGPEYWWDCSVGEVLEYDATQVELGALLDAYGGYILVIGKSIADDYITSLQQGSITPHPDSPQCATTIYDNDGLCARTCYEAFREQYDTGVFGAINGATTIMYRSGSPFSVLFELA